MCTVDAPPHSVLPRHPRVPPSVPPRREQGQNAGHRQSKVSTNTTYFTSKVLKLIFEVAQLASDSAIACHEAGCTAVRGSGHARTVLEPVEAFLRRVGGGGLRRARSAAPTALCAEEGTRGAQRCSRRSVSERRLRAAGGRVAVCHGGSPPSLMKAGFFVHSPCATQVSHLMSSSAHVPSPALAASAASHQPHARRHVAALPAERNHTRRQRRAPHRAASGAAHMKRRLRTQCSSLAHPTHFSSSTHGAGRPSRQRSHESGHSSRMKAWLSWHCPLLIQYSQSAEASEHRPVMTISSPARTAWKMSRLEFSLMCLPADRGRDARSTHPCSHNQLRGNSGG